MSIRNGILNELIVNAQQYVSGQRLCETFGVTRAAIWKHIKALQAEGYEITASTKKGYMLLGLPDRVTPELVSRGIYTERVGRNIDYQIELDSTNRRAKQLAEEGAPHGTLVLCESQSAGRGRLGRDWHSPQGAGLYLSMILRPDLSAQSSLPVTMLAALAVRDAIAEAAGLQAMIKWPNDILLNGKKVAGILTEISGDEGGVRWIVVGVGVNVNNRESDFPESLADSATSLRIERGLECSRLELVRAICYEFEKLYDAFMASDGDTSVFMDRYRVYSCTLARRVTLFSGQAQVTGAAEDFDSTGALLVRTDDGDLKRLFSGEITSHAL